MAVPLMIGLSTSKSPSSTASRELLALFWVTMPPLGVIHRVVKSAPIGTTPQDKNVESERGLNPVGIVTRSRCEIWRHLNNGVNTAGCQLVIILSAIL